MKKTKGPSPIPKQTPNAFPMRINKYLAMKGNSTRRGADELIKKKFVIVNGRIAVLGDKVEATDVVEIRRNWKANATEKFSYYVFNKPPNVQLETAVRNLPLQNVFPVLSLDREARGLVILTNDRRIIDRLTNTPHSVMKEYLIRTHNPLKHNFKEKVEKGVVLGAQSGGKSSSRHTVTVDSTVHIIKDNLFTIRTTDNGNHLRHVCALFMAEVQDFARTKIGTLTLGGIAESQFRQIEGEELEIFLKGLGL
jgi:pseudouridine synthase